MCSGSHEGNPCRSHCGCVCKVSMAQTVEGNLIPPNPAVSDTAPLRNPRALPKHQGVTGTRTGATGRSEGHPSLPRKTSTAHVEELPVMGWAVSPQHWGCHNPKIIGSTASHQPLPGQDGSRTEIPLGILQIHYRISSSSQSLFFFF